MNIQNKIKYTAFLDILGFSNFIKTHITNEDQAIEFHSVIKKIVDYLEYLKTEDNSIEFIEINYFKNMQYDYCWISDTFVLSVENDIKAIEEENHAKAMMLYLLSLVISYINQYMIREYKLCIRGGITSKFTYLKDRLILGEGIVEAHALEKIASNPRVIFAPDVITDEVFNILSLGNYPLISKDCDGHYFVDFLNALFHTPTMIGDVYKRDVDTNEKMEKAISDSLIKFHSSFSEMIEEGLQDKTVYTKYMWLNEYYIRHIKNGIITV